MTGDLGVSPGTAVTGFPPGLITGALHSADAATATARTDATAAYNSAASRTDSGSLTSDDLGGLTLGQGVYSRATLVMSGTLTLDAQGDPNPIFVFQSQAALNVAGGTRVLLINGATACDVYWQVTSSATLGTGAAFAGTVLAGASITANTGASVDGRLLADLAVTLDTNAIGVPACSAVLPTSDVPATVVPTTDVPTTDVPTTDLPTKIAASTIADTASAQSTDVPTNTRAGSTAVSGADTASNPSPTTTALAQTGVSVVAPLTGGVVAVILGVTLLLAARSWSNRGRHTQ